MKFLGVLFLLINVAYSQTNTAHTIQRNGVTREYKLYVPAAYTSGTPVPLVFNLHGYTSNYTEQEAYGNFRPIADTANFIIVHPNGTFDGSGNRYWNAFGFGADDVGFISLLIDHISANYSIDQNRVYSTGMSNGGFMSVELACALSNRIAAVASVTGSMGLNRISVCNPSKPTPVMQINGTSDMTVAYNGTTQYASIPAVVDFWVDKNNCSPTPHQINVPNTNTTDGSTVEHYVYTQGNQDATVELFKVIGGGHTWPGAPIDLPLSGNTNRDIDASIEIWRFFSQFSLNHLLDTDEFELAADHIRIYPNPTDGDIQLEIQGSPTELTICDVAGREVATFKGGDIPSTYNFSEKGVFFISVFSNNQLVTEKVIVE